MKLNFETKEKEKSQVSLKITVDKTEIQSEYDKALNETQKKAQIQGFRKGKVPKSVLEAKFKEGFLMDAANTTIEKAFKEVIEKVDKKPISYAMPKLENFELPKLEEDFVFELVYDTFPEYKFGELSKVEVETNDIKITDDDVKKEIENHQKEFATIQPKEGKIEDKDIVNIEYSVFHDDKEYYKNDNEHIYMDKSYDMFKLGEDIKGMKKGDEKEFSKTFSKEEIEKLAGKTFKIKLKIKEVKHENIPELTDDTAQSINEKCKTADELKTHIKNELIKAGENLKKQRVNEEALDKLIETFKGEIPESMIAEQQELFFRNLIQTMGGNEKKAEQFLKYQNLTKEKYKENMKDNAVKEIKRGLIVQNIVKNEKFEISEADIKEYFEPFAVQTKKKTEEIIEFYTKNGQIDYFKEEIKMKKALDHIFSTIKVKTGKKISLEEYIKQSKIKNQEKKED